MINLIFVVGKSGSGKSYLIDEFLDYTKYTNIKKAVQFTTRPKRNTEDEHSDYAIYFKNKEYMIKYINGDKYPGIDNILDRYKKEDDNRNMPVLSIRDYKVASGEIWSYALVLPEYLKYGKDDSEDINILVPTSNKQLLDVLNLILDNKFLKNISINVISIIAEDYNIEDHISDRDTMKAEKERRLIADKADKSYISLITIFRTLQSIYPDIIKTNATIANDYTLISQRMFDILVEDCMIGKPEEDTDRP